ncbi:MAG: hypothetical protein ACYCYO_02065 [Bacilli bacterium]
MRVQDYVQVGDTIRVRLPQRSIFGEQVLTVGAVTATGVVPRGYKYLMIEHGWYEIVEHMPLDWAKVGDVVRVEDGGRYCEFVVDKVTPAFVRGQNQRDYPGKLLEVRHGKYVVVKRADHGPYVCMYCDQGIKPFQDATYDKDGCWHTACKDATIEQVSKSVVVRVDAAAREYYLRRGFAPTVVVLGVAEMAELERQIPPLFSNVAQTREIKGVMTSVGELRIVPAVRQEHHLEALG